MDREINLPLFSLKYLQFSKRYTSSNIEPKNGETDSKMISKSEAFETYKAIDFILTHDFEVLENVYLLPKVIRLNNVMPGEPRFMRLRTPRVARIRKFN